MTSAIQEPQEFHLGQYVRNVGGDRGTGRVDMIVRTEWLDVNTKLTNESVIYTVTWLDKEGRRTQEEAKALAPAARNVPDFTNAEEAEQWLLQQTSAGGWLDKVDDHAASSAEEIETMMESVVEELTTVTCGSDQCGCQDCFRQHPGDGGHILGFGCACEEKDCGCSY